MGRYVDFTARIHHTICICIMHIFAVVSAFFRSFLCVCCCCQICLANMPPKRESHEERSSRFQRRALEESMKGLLDRCTAAMKKNPQVVPQVYRVLQAANLVEQDQSTNALLRVPMWTGLPPRRLQGMHLRWTSRGLRAPQR